MAYSLSTHYAGQGFLDGFGFFTGNDPSHGFVNYQSREAAQAQGLVSVNGNSVRLGVDTTTVLATSDAGRNSVRLTSHEGFTHGLFIADFGHMPASTCGTWPAFWAFNTAPDTEWPAGGELDIIEGANTAVRNLISGHTESGCQLPSTGYVGSQGPTNCGPADGNIGCNYAAPQSDTTSYGSPFNAEGGGVYALEWDDDDLKIWHFPRSEIPSDITAGKPKPMNWGLPQARFGGSECNADKYFYNMSLVINTNFCGDYAGNVWGKADNCDALAPTCAEYVAQNPEAFEQAYWDVNYIDVYQKPTPSGTGLFPVPSNSTASVSSTRTMTNSASSNMPTRTITLSMVASTPTAVVSLGPKTIGTYALLGCFGSPDGYAAFTEELQDPKMDNGLCVKTCESANKRYAGVHSDTCYCADELGDASSKSLEECSARCPGDNSQFCGGLLAGAPPASGSTKNQTSSATPRDVELGARAAPANIVLTVYGNTDDETAPPGAPGMGTENNSTVVTINYKAVCHSDPSKMCPFQYLATVLYVHCGCEDDRMPTPSPVPMTTCTQTCNGCGPNGESTVTITMPEGAGPLTTHVPSSTMPIVTQIAIQTVVPIPSTQTGKEAAASPSRPIRVVNGATGAYLGLSDFTGPLLTAWLGIFGLMMAL